MSKPVVRKPRILLLSGYDATSHRYWRNILVKGIDAFDWTEVALADRYFSWRVRGNSLSFAFQHREVLSQDYDCLIATSMVDLASLRGFMPQLAKMPNLLYFHENQFDYPVKEAPELKNIVQKIVSAQLTSIYSLLCADKVLFNSKYNQQTFFSGAQKLLKKLPDGIPKQLLKGMQENSLVLPVPVSKKLVLERQKHIPTDKMGGRGPLQIVWNHRWEYDKQPEIFFDAMYLLKKRGIQFKLHVLGQSFRKKPACFEQAQKFLKDEIHTWGYQPKGDYYRILSESDIVVSTALHDFQGLSMLEAILSGCFPVAPNRVAYPEYMNDNNLYQVDGDLDEAESLCAKLMALLVKKERPTSQEQSVVSYLDSDLLGVYQETILASINQFKQTNSPM